MSATGAARSVLVVDDELGMRETLADILSDAGYEVFSAADATTGVDLVQRQHFDVVLMDIRMPGMDGVAALVEMGPPPPPVIMMTAYAVEEQIRQAISSNAFAVVHKPFGVPYLLRLLDRAIDQSPGPSPRGSAA